jgi:hypothetical protein
MRSLLPEGSFKRMVENAIAQIRASSTEKADRRTHRTMSAEDRAGIVRTAVQAELETARTAAVAPCSIREQTAEIDDALEGVLSAMEKAFGRATIEEVVEGMCSMAIETSLAKLGDLLTPANYIAQLHFNEVLDITIERAHDRLMKFQASRLKKSATSVNSLQPDWVARRRRPPGQSQHKR